MRVVLISLVLSCVSFFSSAQAKLPVGVWEGIDKVHGLYKLLEINANNKHYLSAYRLSSKMKDSFIVQFSDNDIQCDTFNCFILTRDPRENLPIKITLTQHAGDGFFVTESSKLEHGDVYSSRFLLKKILSGQTLIERYFTKENESITKDYSQHAETRFGYWWGTLQQSLSEDIQFVTLTYLPNKEARFIVYTPGLGTEAVMTFMPEWLAQDNGALKTKLKGAFFATNMALHFTSARAILLHYEQRHHRDPEQLVSHGNVNLFRFRHGEKAAVPKWLQPMLDALKNKK